MVAAITRVVAWLRQPQFRWLKLSMAAFLLLGLGYLIFWVVSYLMLLNDPRSQAFFQWWRGNEQTRSELITIRQDVCGQAPFILPAEGFIGLLYGDPRGPYSRRRPHQGIDIFSPTGVGETPVYAAYAGYITRENDWKSSLIQRIPEDPLQPGRQIWLYYTHMADRNGNDFIEDAFPPGTHEFFVEQGALLGYTGNYSGNPASPVGTHLHFSIVLDDGQGGYRNELEFDNTVDTSRYLGMAVNYGCAQTVPACTLTPTCEAAILGEGGE